MREIVFAPKGIMVLSLHLLFWLVALRRIWRKNTARLPSKIFWTFLATVIPVIGPVLAMGFATVLRTHGESTPPQFPWRGGDWRGGWR